MADFSVSKTVDPAGVVILGLQGTLDEETAASWEDVLYEVPEAELEEVVVDETMVADKLIDVLEDKDLSRYIL